MGWKTRSASRSWRSAWEGPDPSILLFLTRRSAWLLASRFSSLARVPLRAHEVRGHLVVQQRARVGGSKYGFCLLSLIKSSVLRQEIERDDSLKVLDRTTVLAVTKKENFVARDGVQQYKDERSDTSEDVG